MQAVGLDFTVTGLLLDMNGYECTSMISTVLLLISAFLAMFASYAECAEKI